MLASHSLIENCVPLICWHFHDNKNWPTQSCAQYLCVCVCDFRNFDILLVRRRNRRDIVIKKLQLLKPKYKLYKSNEYLNDKNSSAIQKVGSGNDRRVIICAKEKVYYNSCLSGRVCLLVCSSTAAAPN